MLAGRQGADAPCTGPHRAARSLARSPRRWWVGARILGAPQAHRHFIDNSNDHPASSSLKSSTLVLAVPIVFAPTHDR